MTRPQDAQAPSLTSADAEPRSFAPRLAAAPPVPPSIRAQAANLRRWLFAEALPLWCSVGRDREAGGFHELLDQSAAPLRVAKRARVQARQAYVFATAGLLGWDGAWPEAALSGLEHLDRCYRRPDGLYLCLASHDGAPLDATARLYDQAFVLLALARLCAAGVRPDAMESAAAALREALSAFRHPAGGFREASERPFQANAQMHLLEAALEWAALSRDPAWRALCEEIVELALTRFVDARSGRLLEVFDDAWDPAAGALGRIVEPGHQFEWAWLLRRWSARAGDLRAKRVAAELRRSGAAGVDAELGVALDEVLLDGGPVRRTARLWPQTEWLKAALDAGQDEGGWTMAEAACRALVRFLDVPVQGLWWDRLLDDGTMRAEPAPASSFYHIVTACSVLFSGAEAAVEPAGAPSPEALEAADTRSATGLPASAAAAGN